MDSALLAAVDVVWLPIVGAAFGLGYLVEWSRRRALLAMLRDAEKRSVAEADRAATLARELEIERRRVTPIADSHQHLLTALGRTYHELAVARDRQAVVDAVAAGVERVTDPSQFLVFTAADREGREFVLAAAGGERGSPWAKGARLNETMGRVGLVARRRAAMDRRHFDAEPPIVREQLAQTEPADFLVEVAVPVVVNGQTAAILSVGGSTLSLDATRGGLELLAAHAASVLRALDAGARIERLKNTDELTGLGSKGWFVAEGSELVYRCRMENRPAAVAILAIDDVRGDAGRAGHAAADRLLKDVAAVLHPICAEGTLLARWSGAEFVVLLPNGSPTEAHVFADRLRAEVAAADFGVGAALAKVTLTMSAGVAGMPACGGNLDELIEAAADSLVLARWTGDCTLSAQHEPSLDDAATQEINLAAGSDLDTPR
jgi:diguanylate cyclase (GGDEF)-like protein